MEHNKEKAEAAFAGLGFKVIRGSQYIGNFIGEKANQPEDLGRSPS